MFPTRGAIGVRVTATGHVRPQCCFVEIYYGLRREGAGEQPVNDPNSRTGIIHGQRRRASPLFIVEDEQRLVRPRNLDESRRRRVLYLGGLSKHFVRMMLRGELAVGGDDDRPRGGSVDAEDAQQLGGLALIAGVERRGDGTAIGATRPAGLRVIDVVEAVDVAQLCQRVSLKAE